MFDLIVDFYQTYTEVGNAILVVAITSIALVVWSIIPRPPPRPRPVEKHRLIDETIQKIHPLNANSLPSSLRERKSAGSSHDVAAYLRTPREGSSTALEGYGSGQTLA